MKIINKKNFKKAPKTLWMVRINLSLVSDPYKLTHTGEGSWWDKTGDFDCGIKTDEHSFYKNTTLELGKISQRGYCWDFVTDKKEEADLFYLGATSICKFMNQTWFKHY